MGIFPTMQTGHSIVTDMKSCRLPRKLLWATEKVFLQPPVRTTGPSVWYSKTDFQWSLTSSAKHAATSWRTSRQPYFPFSSFLSSHTHSGKTHRLTRLSCPVTVSHLGIRFLSCRPSSSVCDRSASFVVLIDETSSEGWSNTRSCASPSQTSPGKPLCRNEYWPCRK